MTASLADLKLVASGKVREMYAVDGRPIVMVASDRISAYDVVLPTAIPDKGKVLTQMSVFWFETDRRDRAPTTTSPRTCPRRSPAGRCG